MARPTQQNTWAHNIRGCAQDLINNDPGVAAIVASGAGDSETIEDILSAGFFLAVDYWTCPECGADYGPDREQCEDPDCREHEEKMERADFEEQFARDKKSLGE